MHSRSFVHCLVFLSGMAALSWEVLWQIKSTLALGVSAWGTALTLAVTMVGMSAGSFLMGHYLKTRVIRRPARVYAVLEWVIGVAGLFLVFAFTIIEKLDSRAYALMPESAAVIHILGIIITLGIPTMAMGATLPVLGLIAGRSHTSIAALYGLNTLGAATGTLLAAFLFIPVFGIQGAIWMIAAINVTVGIAAWRLALDEKTSVSRTAEIQDRRYPPLGFKSAVAVVFITGFATFSLEIAWFRSLTAAFMSTTDAFAIMLACVLLALGVSPFFVRGLRKHKSLGSILSWAGIFILLATPIIERFDLFVKIDAASPVFLFMQWFAVSLWVIGLPVLLLGVALPWLLEDQDNPRKWGMLYGVNTLSAVLGSICAGWILLPSIGFASTAWLAGCMVACIGMVVAPREKRIFLAGPAMIALVLAVSLESGAGKIRALGLRRFEADKESKILETYEGPDSTATAVELEDGGRVLFIDGFVATQQADTGFMHDHIHYMAWMGHLPMLAHPDPRQALVICFGTGQTADAVRKNDPGALDIVDVNPNIFRLADNFPANERILDDPRVNAVVMDGRAYLRRVDKTYDVITLEPMPPSFAGMNALYSKQFYDLARSRLGSEGMIAQWLPFHLISHHDSMSITKTFQSVFPNAILWLDPPSKTGILLGSANNDRELGKSWPGYARTGTVPDLSENEVREAVLLNREELEDYASEGTVITDDNQFLAYGPSVHLVRDTDIRGQKHEILKTDAP